MFSPANVSLFTAPVGGRAANGTNNKTREHMVVALLNNDPNTLVPAADHLRQQIAIYISKFKEHYEINPDSSVTAILRGGSNNHHDIDLTVGSKTFKVEFKHGVSVVKDLPQLYQVSVKVNYHHGESYARFFYRGFLKRVCWLYGVKESISEEEYIRKVHTFGKAVSSHPFFSSLIACGKKATIRMNNAVTQIIHKSMSDWLESIKGTLDIPAINTALYKKQSEKVYMLSNDNQFYMDTITTDTLTITTVKDIHAGGKAIMFNTKVSGTTIEMRLTWRNTLGILNPAWQFKLHKINT
jgi:hypothetical protein